MPPQTVSVYCAVSAGIQVYTWPIWSTLCPFWSGIGYGFRESPIFLVNLTNRKNPANINHIMSIKESQVILKCFVDLNASIWSAVWFYAGLRWWNHVLWHLHFFQLDCRSIGFPVGKFNACHENVMTDEITTCFATNVEYAASSSLACLLLIHLTVSYKLPLLLPNEIWKNSPLLSSLWLLN